MCIRDRPYTFNASFEEILNRTNQISKQIKSKQLFPKRFLSRSLKLKKDLIYVYDSQLNNLISEKTLFCCKRNLGEITWELNNMVDG